MRVVAPLVALYQAAREEVMRTPATEPPTGDQVTLSRSVDVPDFHYEHNDTGRFWADWVNELELDHAVIHSATIDREGHECRLEVEVHADDRHGVQGCVGFQGEWHIEFREKTQRSWRSLGLHRRRVLECKTTEVGRHRVPLASDGKPAPAQWLEGRGRKSYTITYDLDSGKCLGRHDGESMVDFTQP